MTSLNIFYPKKNLLIISGPTCTGKSALAIQLAQILDSVIINFDSLLFYKELNVGTAKPNLEQRSLVPHEMIDICSLTHPLNAHEFCQRALPLLEKYLNRQKSVILVGGSGFYLQALLYGMYHSPSTPPDILDQSNQLYQSEGIAPFYDLLKKIDPESFVRLHVNDHYRIRRAVEHFWAHQESFSEAKKNWESHRQLRFPHFHFYCDIEKKLHYQMIQQRTKSMIQNGLIEEVRNLLDQGYTGAEKPLQSIGYKETVDFLQGRLKHLENLEEMINIHTRQLAKSQRTWFATKEKITIDPREGLKKVSHFLETANPL
jgi:tRNA dimethylallyltransferase